MFRLGRKELERTLSEQGGVVAPATILEAKLRFTSGSNYENGPYTVGDHAHMTVKVRVEPEGEPPFEAKIKQTFVHHRPRPGWRAEVIYDPNDRSKIAIRDDSIIPPGITPEQHARSREHQKEAMEALQNGTFSEYIEKRKAEAMAAAANFPGSPVVVTGATPGAFDVAGELTKLADLRDRGVLTEEEFNAEKAKILARP